MLKGEDFDETPAENLMAFSRKNCEQFAGYTNDGTGDDSKTNVILHSKNENTNKSENKMPQVMNEFIKMCRFCSGIGWERCCYS